MIFTVPYDDHSFFLAGRYRGTGSVMKFDKKNAQLRFFTQLEGLTHVTAIATTIDKREEYFFGCGYDDYEERDKTKRENDAWIFRIEDDGEVRWSIRMAGKKPTMRSKGSDLCNGLHYNDATHSLAALVHTKSKQWRLGPKIDDFHDAILVIITN